VAYIVIILKGPAWISFLMYPDLNKETPYLVVRCARMIQDRYGVVNPLRSTFRDRVRLMGFRSAIDHRAE
jgi:hypothetical protein